MAMKSLRAIFIFLVILAFSPDAGSRDLPHKGRIVHPDEKNLYEVFRNPGAEYRPFVRWWWNGARIEKDEILRELDLMKSAGIGGVEINTLKFPKGTDSLGYKVKPYLSPEWKEMMKTAIDGCRERGMICDMIGGSGWPFGGEFLPRDKQLQMLAIETKDVDGGKEGTWVTIDRDSLLAGLNPPIMSLDKNPLKELMYIRLMPKKVDSFTEGIYLDELADEESIRIQVPPGRHVIYFFVKFTGYMDVIEGAPGAMGPVLNHFDSEAVRFYLDKLSECLQFNGSDMKGKVRAAFVDSFELEGANWYDTILEDFEHIYGYSLVPYLPYILRKVGHMGDPLKIKYGCEFSDEVRRDIIYRVRNDFERFQVDLFHDNFISTLNEWCHENGLESRVQCYGRGLHPLESSMFIDIPECETWIRKDMGVVLDDYQCYAGRAHSFVNKYVASGSLLAGNGKVSCEEITNVARIFNTTLEEIKVAGDQSNMSGVNHSVLHGFNYSPKEAEFPGWVKFGTFFSDRNTLWPYFPLWFDYKARISAVLQNSTPQSEIALLPPLEDMWSEFGQQRDPFPEWFPDYARVLWENIHQNGGGCDYVSENIIMQGKVKGGRLHYGPRSYGTIILMSVQSLDVGTARQISEFVESGGRVLCIGTIPYKSSGFKDAAARDSLVRNIIAGTRDAYPGRFIQVSEPEGNPVEWYRQIQDKYGLPHYIDIENPVKWVCQNYYVSGKRDIFFFANYSTVDHHTVTVTFPERISRKQAWIWNPESGERYMAGCRDGKMILDLEPAESRLIVFENAGKGMEYKPVKASGSQVVRADGEWEVTAKHYNGETRTFRTCRPDPVKAMEDPWMKSFAGELYYKTVVKVENPSDITVLDAGKTWWGITGLYLNGKEIGTRWYGDRVFDVTGKLKKGENVLTIKVTTLLGNWTKSLKDNPTAQRHANNVDYRPAGLEGPVILY